MFSKFVAFLFFFMYIYFIILGVLKLIENKSCKKYYLKNRKDCKIYFCRFHKYCNGTKEKILDNENKVLKVKLGENNELDV